MNVPTDVDPLGTIFRVEAGYELFDYLRRENVAGAQIDLKANVRTSTDTVSSTQRIENTSFIYAQFFCRPNGSQYNSLRVFFNGNTTPINLWRISSPGSFNSVTMPFNLSSFLVWQTITVSPTAFSVGSSSVNIANYNITTTSLAVPSPTNATASSHNGHCIRSFKWWRDVNGEQVLMADMKPCKRLADGMPGMYDFVRTNSDGTRFFPASSQDAFTCHNDNDA